MSAAPRSRKLETAFLVERYHRAFEEELARLLGWVEHAREGRDRVLPALVSLAERLAAHVALQEQAVFPVYAAHQPCSSRLHDACSADGLRLVEAIDDARRATCALSGGTGLESRLRHFLDQVQDHLEEEARALRPWSGHSA